MDLQFLQLEAMNGNRKEACDGRGAGVCEAWESEQKKLQLRQDHSKFGDVVVG
jgi:hypothetical protein